MTFIQVIIFALIASPGRGIYDYILENARNNFTDFKVYRAVPKNADQTRFLAQIEDSSEVFTIIIIITNYHYILHLVL